WVNLVENPKTLIPSHRRFNYKCRLYKKIIGNALIKVRPNNSRLYNVFLNPLRLDQESWTEIDVQFPPVVIDVVNSVIKLIRKPKELLVNLRLGVRVNPVDSSYTEKSFLSLKEESEKCFN